VPYDLVLPARLDVECRFGWPIWLEHVFEGRSSDVMQTAGMNAQPGIRSRTQAECNEVRELLGESI
jgi:hypothetical protein